MARKNRRNNQGFSMAALTGKWMLLAVIGVALSLLYVWQHVQLVRTGYAIKGMEREHEKWRKVNESMRLVNERLKNPQRIEYALARKNMGLIFPSAKDIVRLRFARHNEGLQKGKSESEGGADTLLTFRGCGNGAGHNNM